MANGPAAVVDTASAYTTLIAGWVGGTATVRTVTSNAALITYTIRRIRRRSSGSARANRASSTTKPTIAPR